MTGVKATFQSFLKLSVLLVLVQSAVAQELDSASTAKPTDQLENFVLVKIKNRPPVYPRSAVALAVEGWVDVALTVSPDGSVESVLVTDANPKRLFERAAIRAASAWEFVPPLDSGIDTPIVRTQRVSFVLSD